MTETLAFYLFIIFCIVLLVMLAEKVRVAYPILLVLAGLLISFIPAVPATKIDPELIFLIFLPPLLYEAAWNTSWKELWRWRRIIFTFAFVVVFLTAISVAVVANMFIPGFSLALGFLLGGIVSPPDAVSAGAILKFVKVPKRFSSILEGESLLNDASSLIIFRFALVAAATGQFIWQEAATSFLWMCLGGGGIGIGLGFLFRFMHKKFPTDASMDTVLTLLAPFVMYMAAEEVHASGVLSVVCGGLFLSSKRHEFLTVSSRLKSVTFWESLSFLLNGVVFMMIGLGLPQIVSGLGDTSILTAFGYGALVTAVLIAVRFVASFGAVFVTSVLKNFITVADDRPPGWKGPSMIGWTGMRGVVSLAAALSIPVAVGGHPFPQRNLILFITFVVILLTLVVQGLTLPYLIKVFNLTDPDADKSEKQIDYEIRNELAKIAVRVIRTEYPHKIERFPALQDQLQMWENRVNSSEIIFNMSEYRRIQIKILEVQRQWLIEKNEEELLLDEEIVRKHLRLLDLQEERIVLS